VSRPALGPTQPPIQWVPGALSLGVKRPGREADHSLPSSAEIKDAWSYTSTPQYVFLAWCLIKHRDFTFLPVISGDLQYELGAICMRGTPVISGELRHVKALLVCMEHLLYQMTYDTNALFICVVQNL
jgi:hypothetical protein